MFHSISILEKDDYKNLKKMLYRWCEPKMKKKTATFLNIKKKKITKRKKKKCYSYLVYAKNEEKELQHFWSFLEKKLQTLKKKDFTCMLLWEKSH